MSDCQNYYCSNTAEEQRVLLAIVILVSGVVGGLIVVITVVYIYRLCLKRRPPLSTTAKPEKKRYHLRSEATSQCRPLPIPPQISEKSSAVQLLAQYQSVYPQIHVTPAPLQSTANKIIIEIDEPHSPKGRRSSVFHAQKQSEVVGTPYEKETRAAEFPKSQVPKIIATHATGNYLSVDVSPQRARSAEMVLLVPDDEDRRRASFELYKKTGQHRRLLPDIEHLRKQNENQQRKERIRLQSEQQRRRVSELRRCPAFDICYAPRKQTSSPLPVERQQRKIYERGHTFSRSWNPERYEYEEISVDDSDQGIQGEMDSITSPPPPTSLDEPYRAAYQELVYKYEHPTSKVKYVDPLRSGARVVASDASMYPLCRQTSLYDKKVMDDMGRRQVEAHKRQISVRQGNGSHEKNELSQKCVELWADRSNLEVQQERQQSSTEQSASTSFESNTEPIPSDPLSQQKRSSFLELPQTALSKRQKYKNLLLHRKSERLSPNGNSLDSALSTDSNTSMTVNIGTFSTDSTKSDQTETGNGVECTSQSGSSESKSEQQSGQTNQSQHCAPFTSVAQMSQVAAAKQRAEFDCHRRDYSIDSETDRLFQEFVRFDPQYEKQNYRNIRRSSGTTNRRNAAFRLNGLAKRNRTLDIGDISRNNKVSLPLICFSEELSVPQNNF